MLSIARPTVGPARAPTARLSCPWRPRRIRFDGGALRSLPGVRGRDHQSGGGSVGNATGVAKSGRRPSGSLMDPRGFGSPTCSGRACGLTVGEAL
eukprot:scaffold17467_cov65-Phaeocystis_antarctica.AAC.8